MWNSNPQGACKNGLSICQRMGLSVFYLSMLCFLSACSSLNLSMVPPEVKVNSIVMKDSQGLQQHFEVGLSIANPNAKALNIRGMRYSIALNGYELIDGLGSDFPEIGAYQEAVVTVTASANLLNALRFVNNLLAETSPKLAYELTADLDVGGFMGRVRVTEQGDITDALGGLRR